MAKTMSVMSTPSSKMAECFVTINGKRYNFMSAINVEIKFEKEKVEVPILGRMNKGHKSCGSSITGSAEFHKNTPVWNEIAYKFQETGADTYFDMQITNNDPTTDIGKQTIILYDCNFDSITLAAFDADSDDVLTDTIEFTADRFVMKDKYKRPSGVM